MEWLNSRVLDRSDHAFSLPIGPWMIRLGLTVVDILFCANCAEDMIDDPTACPFVMLYKLDAVIGKHPVDFVGYRFDQSFKEAGCHTLCRLGIDSGDDDLGSAVNCDKEEGHASLIPQICNIDMEIADFVGFEPLGLFTIRLRQTGDPMSLQAAMKA